MSGRLQQTLIIVGVGGLALTALIDLLSWGHFAYSGRSLQVALETTALLVAVVLVALTFARYRVSGAKCDLYLVIGVAVLGVANLFRLLLPAYDGDNPLTVWLPLSSRLLAGALLVAAGYIGPDRVSSRREGWRLGLLVGGGAALLLGLVAILGREVSPEINPLMDPADSDPLTLHGSPLLIAAQIASMVLYLVAAVGFARRSGRGGDELAAWLAVGLLLAAFARLNYLLFPSAYTGWTFSGDVFFFFGYMVIFTGALQQVMANQRVAEQTAVLAERARIARDLHDGLAQELAYVALQAQRAAMRDKSVEPIARAASDALEQSRGVIANLRLTDGPLSVAVEEVATALGVRYSVEMAVDVEEAAEADEDQQDDLIRIMMESIWNAVRHGEASKIDVQLQRIADSQIRLRIIDDGQGFDPQMPIGSGGGYGIRGMYERVNRLGGELRLESAPGSGTTVEVVL